MDDQSPTNARSENQTNAKRVAPVDFKLKRAEQKLIVRWQDGHRSELDAATLRQNCPCATCRSEREKRTATSLPVLDLSADQDVRLTGAELMGQYAIKLLWSDGHETGIFDYRYLRSLDPT
jgi:DUF971 family protein